MVLKFSFFYIKINWISVYILGLVPRRDDISQCAHKINAVNISKPEPQGLNQADVVIWALWRYVWEHTCPRHVVTTWPLHIRCKFFFNCRTRAQNQFRPHIIRIKSVFLPCLMTSLYSLPHLNIIKKSWKFYFQRCHVPFDPCIIPCKFLLGALYSVMGINIEDGEILSQPHTDSHIRVGTKNGWLCYVRWHE